jgi:hypothetical protein
MNMQHSFLPAIQAKARDAIQPQEEAHRLYGEYYDIYRRLYNIPVEEQHAIAALSRGEE